MYDLTGGDLMMVAVRAKEAAAGADQRNLSDHGPVALVYSIKSQLPPDQRPLPLHVLRHPRYVQVVHQWLVDANLSSLDVPVRHETVKRIIRLAAQEVRNELQANASDFSRLYMQRRWYHIAAVN